MTDPTEEELTVTFTITGQPRVNPFPGQQLMVTNVWDPHYEGGTFRDYVEEKNVAEANIVTSVVRKYQKNNPDNKLYPEYARPDNHAWYPGTHKPVLDIDFGAKLLPSSTPGHFHLFLDKEMSWEDYVRLLTVLEEVGILESGYVSASISRMHTAVRLPWIKKPVPLHPHYPDCECPTCSSNEDSGPFIF